MRRDSSVGGAIPSDRYIVASYEDLRYAYSFQFMKKVEDCIVGMANNPEEVIFVVEVSSLEMHKVTFLC